MGDCLRAGELSWYLTSYLGRLSMAVKNTMLLLHSEDIFCETRAIMIRISAVTVYYVIMKEYDILSFMDLID